MINDLNEMSEPDRSFEKALSDALIESEKTSDFSGKAESEEQMIPEKPAKGSLQMIIKNIQNSIGSKSVIIFIVRVIIIVVLFILGYSLGKHQNKAEVSNLTAQLPPDRLLSSDNKQKEPPLTGNSDKTVLTGIKTDTVATVHNLESLASTSESFTTGLTPTSAIKGRTEIEIKKEAVSPAPAGPAVAKQMHATATQAKNTSSNSKPLYTLQIAAFRENKMAEEKVTWLKKHGYSAFIVSSELPDQGRWYRVRVGSFSNRAEAKRMQKALRAKTGISPVIMTK
jgi:cell division protein FtsN